MRITNARRLITKRVKVVHELVNNRAANVETVLSWNLQNRCRESRTTSIVTPMFPPRASDGTVVVVITVVIIGVIIVSDVDVNVVIVIVMTK